MPPATRGLSARLLALTVLLVLLGEVMIYVPSISRFRVQYLGEKLAAAHLATAVLLIDPDADVGPETERKVLDQAGLAAVVVRDGPRTLVLGDMPPVDVVVDLAGESVARKITAAFATMLTPPTRMLRVFGPSPADPGVTVDLIMREAPMQREMVAYSGRIVTLSLFLSAVVAGSLFLILQRLIVAPLRRLTASVTAFRENPEDPDAPVPATARRDELGVVQAETARMQSRIRDALRQRERLAALGAAVGKINHDLRNVLGTAMLLSDRLEASADPQVTRVAPRLLAALERATKLCAETLAYAKSEPPALARERVRLAPLVDTCAEAAPNPGQGWRLRNEVPYTLEVDADRDQLYRVFANLFANAADAMADHGGLVAVRAWREAGRVVVEVADTGPGLPAAVREHLFEAFVGTGRPGGTGLGLHIARDVARRHGGDLVLARSGAEGTAFRLLLKDAARGP
jgi:signal transduction histidine kinase